MGAFMTVIGFVSGAWATSAVGRWVDRPQANDEVPPLVAARLTGREEPGREEIWPDVHRL